MIEEIRVSRVSSRKETC